MTDYERRVSFLSKLTATPPHEVDRVMAYVQTLFDQHGPDVKLDAYDISCYTKVKLERVARLLSCVAELNVHSARFEPYINKTKWR